jgi:hypothetical protein
VISAFFRLVNEIALFWDVTQRRVVMAYLYFGATYRVHFQGLINPGKKKKLGLLDP